MFLFLLWKHFYIWRIVFYGSFILTHFFVYLWAEQLYGLSPKPDGKKSLVNKICIYDFVRFSIAHDKFMFMIFYSYRKINLRHICPTYISIFSSHSEISNGNLHTLTLKMYISEFTNRVKKFWAKLYFTTRTL